MIKLFALIAFGVTFLFCGCSADAPERAEANNSGKTIANATNARARSDAPASNTEQGPQNAASVGPNSELRNKKLEQIRAAGGDPSVPKPDIESLLKTSERPAPEDSVFAVALVDIVFERRRFLKHPLLAKVEKVTGADGKASITVVTRDGKSFDLAGNVIGPVSTVSTSTILRAIGLENPTVDRKQRSITEKN